MSFQDMKISSLWRICRDDCLQSLHKQGFIYEGRHLIPQIDGHEPFLDPPPWMVLSPGVHSEVADGVACRNILYPRIISVNNFLTPTVSQLEKVRLLVSFLISDMPNFSLCFRARFPPRPWHAANPRCSSLPRTRGNHFCECMAFPLESPATRAMSRSHVAPA